MRALFLKWVQYPEVDPEEENQELGLHGDPRQLEALAGLLELARAGGNGAREARKAGAIPPLVRLLAAHQQHAEPAAAALEALIVADSSLCEEVVSAGAGRASAAPTPSPTRSVSEMSRPVRSPATHCTLARCRRRHAWRASSATRF
jgi:hypothetical protein